MTEALSIKGLKKTYKNGLTALRGIDLDVQEGDFFALLGPNGAGKSTVIGIITSLVNKTEGRVSVFDHDIDTHFSEAKRLLGVVPQEFNFNQFEAVIDIVVNQAGYYGLERRLAHERAEICLNQLGLWEKRSDKARSLSGGMKRRLMIARALLHQPKLLILDEPTAGVDIEIRRSMWEFLEKINAEGTTIILTTHYLEEAENLCRSIAVINDGLLIENTSMRAMLDKLHIETFVLYLREPLHTTPELPGIGMHRLDNQTIEVSLSKEQSINNVFSLLSAHGVEVVSLKNKTNRLEELFMELVAPATGTTD